MITTLIIISGLLLISNLIFLGKMAKFKMDQKDFHKLDQKRIDQVKKLEMDKHLFETTKETFKKKLVDSYNLKLTELKSVVNRNIRKGVYEKALIWTTEKEKEIDFKSHVYVIEIDRYKNGKSKIKLDYINVGKHPNESNKKSIEDYIKLNFKELVDTNSIDWLESVDGLQKDREKKLNRILK